MYIHVFNAGRGDHIFLMRLFNIIAASIVSQGLSYMVEMGGAVEKCGLYGLYLKKHCLTK